MPPKFVLLNVMDMPLIRSLSDETIRWVHGLTTDISVSFLLFFISHVDRRNFAILAQNSECSNIPRIFTFTLSNKPRLRPAFECSMTAKCWVNERYVHFRDIPPRSYTTSFCFTQVTCGFFHGNWSFAESVGA